MGAKAYELIKIGLLLSLVWTGYAPRAANAQSFCESCEVQVGLDGTYHYWGATGSLVLPVLVQRRDPPAEPRTGLCHSDFPTQFRTLFGVGEVDQNPIATPLNLDQLLSDNLRGEPAKRQAPYVPEFLRKQEGSESTMSPALGRPAAR
jgi:hypothetical protein